MVYTLLLFLRPPVPPNSFEQLKKLSRSRNEISNEAFQKKIHKYSWELDWNEQREILQFDNQSYLIGDSDLKIKIEPGKTDKGETRYRKISEHEEKRYIKKLSGRLLAINDEYVVESSKIEVLSEIDFKSFLRFIKETKLDEKKDARDYFDEVFINWPRWDDIYEIAPPETTLTVDGKYLQLRLRKNLNSEDSETSWPKVLILIEPPNIEELKDRRKIEGMLKFEESGVVRINLVELKE